MMWQLFIGAVVEPISLPFSLVATVLAARPIVRCSMAVWIHQLGNCWPVGEECEQAFVRLRPHYDQAVSDDQKFSTDKVSRGLCSKLH